MTDRFDFGLNWRDYSEAALDEQKYVEAKNSLKTLFGSSTFQGLSFLDVGCGSGIFSIAAMELGAKKVVGIDISDASIETSKRNVCRLGPKGSDFNFLQMDVLKEEAVKGLGLFDRVYSWGVLHHTGKMWEAIDVTCKTVKPGGTFVLAIYNKHFTSGVWEGIKKLYNLSPKWIQKIMVFFFYGVIFTAKWMVTFKNPTKMKRGMDFYHDVVDWVGGYPYEYASQTEVIQFMEARGFKLKLLVPYEIPLQNNQYVFVKNS